MTKQKSTTCSSPKKTAAPKPIAAERNPAAEKFRALLESANPEP